MQLQPLMRVVARGNAGFGQVDEVEGEEEGWGKVLDWMHAEGVNFAGFAVSMREREDCASGRCRCLGPLSGGR